MSDIKMILLLNRIGKHERMTRREFTYNSNAIGKGYMKSQHRIARALKKSLAEKK